MFNPQAVENPPALNEYKVRVYVLLRIFTSARVPVVEYTNSDFGLLFITNTLFYLAQVSSRFYRSQHIQPLH